MGEDEATELRQALDRATEALEQTIARHRARFVPREIGTVQSVGRGIAQVTGLPTIKAEELVLFENGMEGMALNLDPDRVGVVLLGERGGLRAGQEVHRTGRVFDVPVGEALLGRVVDATGAPLDGRGPIRTYQRDTIEREAPGVMDRAPVDEPLQTGIKVIDALMPIGRGQRELILGDRQTGKTAIAVDTMLNQRGKDVVCVYCAVGQRDAAVTRLIDDLGRRNAMRYTIVVVASGDVPPGLQYVAPYAATTMAEYFRDRGRDVLIVYDDLTQHARAYRELSLLLRRPPGREAFPGDIFYVHSRMLERSTHLRDDLGGGSLTALPIIQTEAENISAYIPTNLISMTDGQIYLSPTLYARGVLPAVDVGRSVSRVGGRAQLPAYRVVASDLRLTYTQYQELEAFARFGTRLEETTRRQLERGRRVREALKQSQYDVMSVPEQIGVLLAVTEGVLDDVPAGLVGEAEPIIRRAMLRSLPEVAEAIAAGEELSREEQRRIVRVVRDAIHPLMEGA